MEAEGYDFNGNKEAVYIGAKEEAVIGIEVKQLD